MELPEPFRRAVVALESAGVQYFITGSLASMYWGKVRTTEGMDVVAALSLRDVGTIASAFPPSDYYVDQRTIGAAIEQGGQFNIIHLPTAFKVDVIQMESTPFAELCMTRRVRADIACPATWIASPEEIILNKVKFFELGGSEKHINDIAWIVQVRG